MIFTININLGSATTFKDTTMVTLGDREMLKNSEMSNFALLYFFPETTLRKIVSLKLSNF